MDLYQLKYFLEVARELSFSRAAANLYVSPPAVSRSVSLLERSLKKRLFVRTKRRVTLTADGELLKAKAQRAFDEIESARLELEGDSRENPAKLRIGSREMITHYLLTQPLLAFKKTHPQMRFAVYELDPQPMVEALKKDQIEFGLYYSPLPDPALETHAMGTLSSHIYAAKSLLPGRRPPGSVEEVLKLPFIAPRYFHADPLAPSLDGFPDSRFRRNIQYEGEFLETHRRFVLDGLAAAVLPDFVMEKEWRGGSILRLPGPKLSREIYFFKRRSRPLPDAVGLFYRLLTQTIRRAKPASDLGL